MAGITIRELVTKWAFRTDAKKLQTFERGLIGLKHTAAAVGSGLFRMAKVMALPVAAAAGVATYALKEVVEAAAYAEEAESKFDAVFKTRAANMRQWSNDISKTVQRNSYDLRNEAATFGALFNAMQFSEEGSADLSKTLTQLTVDLGSFHNEAESDVMMSLRSGLLGNVEPMLKYGAVVKASAVEQELLSQGIKKSKKGYTEQQKVLGRLAIMLKATKDAQGDAARTSTSFTNRMRGLKAGINEMAIEIGSRLLPILSPLVGQLKDAADRGKEWISANKALIQQKLDEYFRRAQAATDRIDWRRVWQGVKDVAAVLMGLGKAILWVHGKAGGLKFIFGLLFGAAVVAAIWNTVTAVQAIMTAFQTGALAAGGMMALVMVLVALGAYIYANWDEIYDIWKDIPRLFKEIGEGIDMVSSKFSNMIKNWKPFTDLYQWAVGAPEAQGLYMTDMRQLSMPMPTTAPAGIPGAGGSSLVFAPKQTINVPPGTPATLAKRVGESVQQANVDVFRQAREDVRR